MQVGDFLKIVKVGKPLPQSLIGQRVEVTKLLSESFVAIRTGDGNEYLMMLENLKPWKPENPGLRLWREAKIAHLERVIPRLASKAQYWSLVRSLQAEYEALLQLLGINDEEVEF
jgi:hypothetical protein